MGSAATPPPPERELGRRFQSPGPIKERAGDSAAALFDDGEKPEIRGPGTNQFVPYDQEKAEAAYFSK